LSSVESIDYLKYHLKLIEEWEKEQKDLWIWEKIGRIPFTLLDKITPRLIQDKIGTMVNEIGNFIQTGGQYLINEKSIMKKFHSLNPQIAEGELNLADIKQLPFSQMDKVSSDIKKSRTNMATVQGATTGVGGLFTLALDIPMLLALSLKVLQEIALCYGFNPQEKAERIFIVKCLQFTYSDIVGKNAILDEISSFDEQKGSQQMMSQLEGWREVGFTYLDNMGWKKLFQMIPIAGIIFGAFLNRSTLKDVAETGIMLYSKRRLMEKVNQMELQVPYT